MFLSFVELVTAIDNKKFFKFPRSARSKFLFLLPEKRNAVFGEDSQLEDLRARKPQSFDKAVEILLDAEKDRRVSWMCCDLETEVPVCKEQLQEQMNMLFSDSESVTFQSFDFQVNGDTFPVAQFKSKVDDIMKLWRVCGVKIWQTPKKALAAI